MIVEFSWRLLLFFIVVGLIQTALDALALSAWRSFVRRRGWNAWLYIAPIVVGVVMFCLFPYTVYLRQTEWYPSSLNKILHKILAVWYMPKILVAAFLLSLALLRQYRKHLQTRLVGWLEWATVQASSSLSSFSSLFSFSSSSPGARKIARFFSSAFRSSPPERSPQRETSLSRRAFLSKATHLGGYAVAAAPLAALGADAYFTLYDFDVRRVQIPVKNLPRQFEGFTIAQISDIHAGSFFSDKPMQEVCRILEDLKPDMTVVTGDWVNWKFNELPAVMRQIERLARFAARPSAFGAFGCLGNHDHYVGGAAHDELLAMIRSSGVRLLVNENAVLDVDGARLQLGAIDNVGLRQNYGKLNLALEGFSPENPTILLAHDPTFWDKRIHAKPFETEAGALLVELTLSGHTHGGQVGLNLLGVGITPAALMYKQIAGLYADDYHLGQHIYVNRGIGTTGIPLRIGIPPEITLISLTSEARRGSNARKKEENCKT
jgi:predicted MPP superfamily phosphohydrolase